MDRSEAVETLYHYALQVPNDLMFGEYSKKAKKDIDEAYNTLQATFASDTEADEKAEQDLIHIYGSKENILNLRPLTHKEYYEEQRAKVLGYITAWPDDNRQERWQSELEELDAWYTKVSNDSE